MKGIVFACMLSILACVASVRADDCPEITLKRVDAYIEHSEWFEKALAKTLGPDVTDFDFNNFEQCRKMVPVARKRLEFVGRIIELDERSEKACSNSSPTPFGDYTATEMRVILKEYIAVCSEDGDSP